MSDELETARLRRELAEWRKWSDHHSAWALCNADRPPDAEIRDGLGDLLDIATGEEMARVHGERAKALLDLEAAKRELAEVTKERDAVRVELDEARDRTTRVGTAFQVLVDALRASLEEAVSKLEKAERETDGALSAFRFAEHHRIIAERERDEALAKLELHDDHRRADGQTIDRLEYAIRALIDSVTASRTRDAIVLRDIEAARALIGEGRSVETRP